MKKFFKLFSLIIISFNSIAVSGCSLFTNETYSRDYKVSLLRYKNLPVSNIDFIKFYEQQIKVSASAESELEFDILYDNNPDANLFKTYNQLNQDLTNTQMGPFKCQVDWPSLFKSVDLTKKELNQAQNGILYFNNILAKVYGKINTLRLVQRNEVISTQENIIAYTQTTGINQIMEFGPNFVNATLINQQYQIGFWATNNIDSVIVHEYGHALSNFIGVYPNNRDSYNNSWPLSKTNKTNLKTNDNYLNSSINLINKLKIPHQNYDRTQLLMNFLVQQGHNYALNHRLTSYYDPESSSNNKLLFPYILLQSNYGRSYLRTGKNKDEFFAESFATWLLTPKNQRRWNWELFNKFFVELLPSYLKYK